LFCLFQLEDEYSLFDYNINVNDMVQIMEKIVFNETPDGKTEKEEKKADTVAPEPMASTSSSNPVSEICLVYFFYY
jgi:hypothetical protein